MRVRTCLKFRLIACLLLLGGLMQAGASQNASLTLHEIEIGFDPGSPDSLIGSDQAFLDGHLLLTAASAQVLVFEVTGDQPELVQTVDLIPPQPGILDVQVSLAVDGNRVLVGAAGGVTPPSDQPLGRVLLFEWVDQRLQLLAEDRREGSESFSFGQSVALVNGLALVGEPESNGGIVHVLDANNDLAPLATVSAPAELSPDARFGADLAASSETLAVAAPGPLPGQSGGSIALYQIDQTNFVLQTTLSLPWADLGSAMGWVDQFLFVYGATFDAVGTPFGHIVRIRRLGASNWVFAGIFQMPDDAEFDRSLAGAFSVDQDELLALGLRVAGPLVEEVDLVRWPQPVTLSPGAPDVLATSAELQLDDIDTAARLTGVASTPDRVFIADTRRPVRDLAAGGALQLSRKDDNFSRAVDVVPMYPGHERQLGQGFAAGPDHLYISAPGWCEVLEVSHQGEILRRFESPADPAACGGFGKRVEVIGDELFVAAPFLATDPLLSPMVGGVYRFDLGTGALLETLAPATPLGLDRYGANIIRHQDRLLVVGKAVIEAWSFASGSGERVDIIDIDTPPSFNKPGADVRGSRVAFTLSGTQEGEAIALEWDGNQYQVLPALPSGGSVVRRGVLWADDQRLLVETWSEEIRVFDLLDGDWLEREPLPSPQLDGFGQSMARNPCALLIADDRGISRFSDSDALPDGGQRLSLDDFGLQDYEQGFSFVNTNGQDFVSISSLSDTAVRLGAVYRFGQQSDLFSDRFETRCSF